MGLSCRASRQIRSSADLTGQLQKERDLKGQLEREMKSN